jgi:predicted nucleic acid-binding protein
MKLLDTTVILGALDPGERNHLWCRNQMGSGDLLVNTAVLAELCVQSDEERLREWLEGQGIAIVSLPSTAAGPAGRAFGTYLERRRAAGALPLGRMPLPDFLIGAHAVVENQALLTRDGRRYRQAFPGLKLITPQA